MKYWFNSWCIQPVNEYLFDLVKNLFKIFINYEILSIWKKDLSMLIKWNNIEFKKMYTQIKRYMIIKSYKTMYYRIKTNL